ncbi:hypothetical protein J32TS6_27320 [Virgibacillus pantothenticus]|nr:hypothetical protein J32TS6_27320 [Virgibacillus pantothenticus]
MSIESVFLCSRKKHFGSDTSHAEKMLSYLNDKEIYVSDASHAEKMFSLFPGT